MASKINPKLSVAAKPIHEKFLPMAFENRLAIQPITANKSLVLTDDIILGDYATMQQQSAAFLQSVAVQARPGEIPEANADIARWLDAAIDVGDLSLDKGAYISALRKWPENVMRYRFEKNLNHKMRLRVQEAVKQWNNSSLNLRIEEIKGGDGSNDNKQEFVIVSGQLDGAPECASSLGIDGKVINKSDHKSVLSFGKRVMGLAETCKVGNILHEFMHSAGILHEHERPEADIFLKATMKHDLQIHIYKGDLIKTDYDPCSIMHYGDKIELNSSGKELAEKCRKRFDPPLPDNMKVPGQRERLSENDVAIINLIYKN
jgi:hypothetical protein